MSILRRALSATNSRSGPTLNSVPIPSNVQMGHLSSTGLMITDKSAMSLPTFYRCCQILSGDVAKLPLKVYTETNGIKTEIKAQPPIVTSPFLQATIIEGLEQIMLSLLWRGNAYAFVTDRDSMERPTQLWVAPADMVRVTRETTGQIVYSFNGTDYDPSAVVHIKMLVPPGALMGLSLIESLKQSIGIGLASQELAGSFYANGALQSGFLNSPTAIEPDDARLIAETFKASHTGLAKAFNPAVLSGGITWVTTSITPDEAQFLETRAFSQSELAMIFGIPPHMLGMVDKTTSWGTGIEVQGRAYVDNTLSTFLARIEEAFTALLPAGVWAEFDTDSLTRPDTATRYANYAVATMNGFLNVDEVRAMEGDAPLEDGKGETYYHLSTLVPMGQSGATPPPNVDPDNPTAIPASAPVPAIEA